MLLLFQVYSALVIDCNFLIYLRIVYASTYCLIENIDGSFALRVAFGLTAPRYIGCGNDLKNVCHAKRLRRLSWKFYLVVANISRVEHCEEKATARDGRGKPQASVVNMKTEQDTTISN